MILFRRFSAKYITLGLVTIFIIYYLNPVSHLFEKDFATQFDYPYQGNVNNYVYQLRHGEKPALDPINSYNYTFISNCKHKCWDVDVFLKPRLVFIVKSAMSNFERRAAIRRTWGYERRFSDVTIRTIFTLGVKQNDNNLQADIRAESEKYKDIVQSDFIDSYYNNTIKTMMGFRWAVTYCPNSQFYMFVDDDMYVSAKNVLRFIRNPIYYPGYLQRTQEDMRQLVRESREIKQFSEKTNNETYVRAKRQMIDYELPSDARLFAGYVFFNSSPHRHHSSKWYISLEEYPWDQFPPYVTAAAIVVSREALLDLYYTSLYTKHFRFDDIYLGIVAKKAALEPLFNEEFYFYPKSYTGHQSYRYLISSHGYDNPTDLEQVWREAKSAGHA